MDGPSEYLLSGVSSATLLAEGSIAVADRGGTIIRIYGSDGTFQRELGRPGEGPGEFGHIHRVSTSGPDTIVAHDSDLFRVSRFTTDGELVSTTRLEAEDGRPEVFIGEYSTGEFAFAWIEAQPRRATEVTPDVMGVARFSEEGHLEARLGSMDGMLRLGGSPLAFSPHFHASMIGDSLFVTNGREPTIEVWDTDGRLVRTVDVPLPAVGAERAWRELAEGVTAGGTEWQQRQFEEQPRDQRIPRIASMRSDEQGRLWVKPYDPATDSHLIRPRGLGGVWWVMEPSGAVIAELTLPHGLQLMDMRGDRILGLMWDDLGVEQLRVYDLLSVE